MSYTFLLLSSVGLIVVQNIHSLSLSFMDGVFPHPLIVGLVMLLGLTNGILVGMTEVKS